MRIPILFTCVAAATLATLPLRPVLAQDNGSATASGDVTFSLFYDNLSDDGEWYNTPDYGYVWQPDIAYGADNKWRPYTDGYWAQTDSGWTWVSYENFGWATYHYGRWTRLKDIGWAWVPGYEWGPGWVSWRTDNDYVGWAPLPPKSELVADTTVDDDRPAPPPRRPRPEVIDYEDVEPVDTGYSSNVDVDYDIGPENYCFVETRSFGAPVLSEVILPPQRNLVIIERTRNVTNIYYDRRGRDDVSVYNSGPDFGFINAHVDQPIQRLQIEQRRDPGFLAQGLRAGGNPTQVHAGILSVAAPMFARRPTNFQQIKPVRVKETLAAPQVVHGWSNSGADPQTVQRLRTQFKQQAQQAPPKAAQPKEQVVQPLPPAQRVVTKSNLPVGQPKDMSAEAVAARRAQHQQQRAAQGGQPAQPGNPAQAIRPGQATQAGQPGQALPPGQKDQSPEAKAARQAQREAARNGQPTQPGQPAAAGQPNTGVPRPGALTDDERKARRDAAVQARDARDQARTSGQPAAQGQAAPAGPQPAQPAGNQPGQKDQSPEAKAARKAQRQQERAAQQGGPAAPAQAEPARPAAEPARPAAQPGQTGQNGQSKDQSAEAKAARRAQRQQQAAQESAPAQQPAEPARPQANPQADQEREVRRAQRQQEQAGQQREAQQAQRQQPAAQQREAEPAQRQPQPAAQPREAQSPQRQPEHGGQKAEKGKPGEKDPNQ